MQDIILFGIQGAGKGTQAKILAKKFDYKIFETGAELRAMAKSSSDLGKKIRKIIDQGSLVDTKIIIEIIEVFLNNVKPDEKIIFDGIPRNQEQKQQFEQLIKKMGRTPMAVNIKLSKEEALNRVLSRFICEGVDTTSIPLLTEAKCIALGGKVVRRNDDNEKSIKVRINAFFNETQPIINEYQKEKRLIEIDGNNPVDIVTQLLIDKLSKK